MTSFGTLAQKQLRRGCIMVTSLIQKTPPRRTLQKPNAWEPEVILGGWAISYERGTPVHGGARSSKIDYVCARSKEGSTTIHTSTAVPFVVGRFWKMSSTVATLFFFASLSRTRGVVAHNFFFVRTVSGRIRLGREQTSSTGVPHLQEHAPP